MQGARARPRDRPGRGPVCFRSLRTRPLGHARIDGHRALALDQATRDIIGGSRDDRVERLAFGHQHTAIARVLEKSIGALVVRHVDKRDHVDEEARMLALCQRQIKQIHPLRRLVDNRLQRALKRLEADNLQLAHLRNRVSALGVLDPSLPNRSGEVRLGRDVLRLVVHQLVFVRALGDEGSANLPDRKLSVTPGDFDELTPLIRERRLPITSPADCGPDEGDER